jgi:hypothetical protein
MMSAQKADDGLQNTTAGLSLLIHSLDSLFTHKILREPKEVNNESQPFNDADQQTYGE